MDELTAPTGTFQLERVPVRPRQPLRAWDAADEYVLELLAETPPEPNARVLLVNDSFGALATALRPFDPIVINESAAGRHAIAENLARNECDPVPLMSMLELDDLETSVDTVVIKIPKSNAHLVDLLHRLRPHLRPESRIVGAAMARHVRTATLECFESIIGPTTTSLARKKARLLHVSFDPELTVDLSPWPTTWKHEARTHVTHGGGFSPESVDVGTRFLLDNLPTARDLVSSDHDVVRVVDLGCGNGIIGLRVVSDFTAVGIDHQISFVDDSALAIDATRRSWEATHGQAPDPATVAFVHTHRVVENIPKRSVNLVLINPPFHDDRVVGDDIAWTMFTDAHKILAPGGQLVVVGNRHLAYHAKLRKIFGQVDTVAATSKFVLLRAHR